MADSITIEFDKNEPFNRHTGEQRKAITFTPDAGELRHCELPLITLRIGFESITMTQKDFGGLLAALRNAEAAGSQYPEDWLRFHGLKGDD